MWPYLLGHYKFGSTAEEREELDKGCRQNYETTMSEWLAVEAIVRQRDKEMMAANLAKLSSESTSGADIPPQTPTTGLAQDLSNDVSSFKYLNFYKYMNFCKTSNKFSFYYDFISIRC